VERTRAVVSIGGAPQVVATRPAGADVAFLRCLESLGIAAASVPMIDVVPLDGSVDALVDALRASPSTWVACTSASAASAVADALGVVGVRHVAAVGPSTATALAGRGVHVDLVAPIANAASLADALASVAAVDVVAAVAARALVDLAEGLATHGVSFRGVAVYETVPAVVDDAGRALLQRADLVTVASPSAVQRLADVGFNGEVVALGSTTAAAARAAGFVVAAVATAPSPEALATACAHALEARGGPGRPA
jgi:uroporphyrinogen-III synthase